jgi:hypothetical protein
MCTKKPVFAGAILAIGSILASCAQMTAFEAKAAPEIAQGCAVFHQAEASPLVQIGIGVGVAAANTAMGGVPAAGLAVSAVKGFGDAFCAAGPPIGDTTTPGQQASWLAGVTQQMIGAALAASAK